MKTKICFCILIAAFTVIPPAVRANTQREVVRLQHEITLLQKQFQEFNTNHNERLDVLRSLIIQLNDEIARSNNTLSRITVALDSRTTDARNQDKSLQTEIRELSEKVDDVSIRISVLAQQINDYKLQTAMQADGAASSLTPDNIFNQAMRDYMQGEFDMAIEGFRFYIETHPGGETAARAWLYIGESYHSQNKMKEAVEAFSRIINDYPQAPAVPTALYKRANTEIALQNRDNAIADFRDIIQRFPKASEADQARVELQRLQSAKPATKTTTLTPSRKPAGR